MQQCNVIFYGRLKKNIFFCQIKSEKKKQRNKQLARFARNVETSDGHHHGTISKKCKRNANRPSYIENRLHHTPPSSQTQTRPIFTVSLFVQSKNRVVFLVTSFQKRHRPSPHLEPISRRCPQDPNRIRYVLFAP
jgi:hypothetical protein